MKYNTFGDLLKELRISRNMSQEEACYGICDRRTYIRWEKNQVDPSNYNIHMLSNRFNYDLHAYYKFLICNKNKQNWDIKQNAEKYINTQDWCHLFDLIKEIELTTIFISEDDMKLLYYYKALYYSNYTRDYLLSNKYCLKALQLEYKDFSLENLSSSIYTNVGLCLLNCFACNLIQLKLYKEANTVWFNILNSIEQKVLPDITYYQSCEFEIKLYQTTIYNLALYYKKDNNYSSALFYLDKGISFSITHNSLYDLADLLKLKYKVLYALERYKDAAEAYRLSLCLYQLQNNLSEINKCEDLIHSTYPEISKYQ